MQTGEGHLPPKSAARHIQKSENDNVMMDKKTNREKWLHLRLTDAELATINQNFRQTTQPKLSDYCRALLLGIPIVKTYRNQSLDTLISEFAILNKTLNGIANNYNQALHELHQLTRTEQVKQWFVTHEMDRRKLLEDVSVMKDFMQKKVEEWLQS
jgi:inhibitor of KinA sporulation pathway (predicted exonuclease)